MQDTEFLTIDTTAPTRVLEEKLNPFPILTEGHPKLREKMPEFDITQISQPEIQRFIKQMRVTQATYNGLGLSANQVGIRFRMFVIGDGIVCFNPTIKEYIGFAERKVEGCLSFPGLYLHVPRYNSIIAEYYDGNSEKQTVQFDGLTAQIYQHELDHMNGIVYTEHVKPVAMQMARKKQAKIIKKFKRSR
jgi:peptide deformylase